MAHVLEVVEFVLQEYPVVLDWGEFQCCLNYPALLLEQFQELVLDDSIQEQL